MRDWIFKKYRGTRSRDKTAYLLFILLQLVPFCIQAQNDPLIFDLDKGRFNTSKLGYLEPLTITGKAEKDGKSVDIIRLDVTRNFKKENEELLKAIGELALLGLQLAQIEANQTGLLEIESKVAILAEPIPDNEKENLITKFTLLGAGFEGFIILLEDKNTTVNVLKSKITIQLNELLKSTTSKKTEITRKGLEIQLKEIELGQKQTFNETWIKKDGETNFSFTLPERLEMSEEYTFTFQTYSKNSDPFPVERLLSTFFESTISKLEENGNYPKDDIIEDFDVIIKKIQLEVFSSVLYYDEVKKTLDYKYITEVHTPVDLLATKFRGYFEARKNIENQESTIAGNRQNFIKEIEGNKAFTKMNKVGYTLLIDLMDEKGGDHEESIKKILKDSGFDDLFINTNIQSYQLMKEARLEIPEYESQLNSSFKIILNEFEKIKSFYVTGGPITTKNSTSAGGATDVDGIRISTTYGIGSAILESGFSDTEWFQFLGLNFRFDDYDKRIPGSEAFKSGKSRWSLMVGLAVTSNMQYKGSQLQNTRLGFKPVIGLNWEPLRGVNIGTGIISFLQDPSIGGHEETKIKPYLSMSFDFNVFNNLIQKK
jgi:hypothetical protein